MIRTLLILALLSVLPLDMSVQIWVGYKSDSVRIAEYRGKIGLDYSMPDYCVTSIDKEKMGSRLANLLRFYEEVKKQGSYSRWIGTILGEQYEAFEHSYVEVKKQKLMKAYKSGNVIS